MRGRPRPVPAAALVLALSACAGASAVEGPVRLGRIARVSGPRVRPERVIEDSRCPVDARCIQAGRVVLRATVLTGGGARTHDLVLGTPVTVADGALTLVSVTPDRAAGRPLPPSAYRFGFAFQGGR